MLNECYWTKLLGSLVYILDLYCESTAKIEEGKFYLKKTYNWKRAQDQNYMIPSWAILFSSTVKLPKLPDVAASFKIVLTASVDIGELLSSVNSSV